MKIKLSKLDVLFSIVIRLRAKGRCEYCGKPAKRLECSHFIGRRNRSVRWDMDNAASVDFSCHQYLDEHPYKHVEWFKKRLGSQRFEELNIRAETITKFSDKDIEAMIEKYKKMIYDEKLH